jgi:hypothetical protein
MKCRVLQTWARIHSWRQEHYLRHPAQSEAMAGYLKVYYIRHEVWSVTKKILFENTAIRLWSQRSLYLQGDAGHPSWQGWRTRKESSENWRAKEEERHIGSVTSPPPHKRRKKISLLCTWNVNFGSMTSHFIICSKFESILILVVRHCTAEIHV